MATRLIELAIEALQRRKADVEAEITALQAQIDAPKPKAAARPARRPAGKKRGRRGRTASARKAQSEKMLQYWAKRRAEEGKSS